MKSTIKKRVREAGGLRVLLLIAIVAAIGGEIGKRALFHLGDWVGVGLGISQLSADYSDENLRRLAEELNGEILPRAVSPGLEWVRADALGDQRLRYQYFFTEYASTDLADLDDGGTEIDAGTFLRIGKELAAEACQRSSGMLAAGVILIYAYSWNDGVGFAEFQVTAEDCG